MSVSVRRTKWQQRLHRALCVWVALAVFSLLTATVWYKEDHDGYQGTHLFFMPRKTWERDEGRGMLYKEEHYRRIDRALAVEELFGPGARYEEYEEYGEYEEYEEEYEEYKEEEYEEYEAEYEVETTVSSQNPQSAYTPSPALRKSRHVPPPPGNEMPVNVTVQAVFPQTKPIPTPDLAPSPPIAWVGDVPTPPPRGDSLASS